MEHKEGMKGTRSRSEAGRGLEMRRERDGNERGGRGRERRREKPGQREERKE